MCSLPSAPYDCSNSKSHYDQNGYNQPSRNVDLNKVHWRTATFSFQLEIFVPASFRMNADATPDTSAPFTVSFDRWLL